MKPQQHRLSAAPFLVLLALLICLAIVVQRSLAVIPFVPASAGEKVFSAERAKENLEHLIHEQIPHPVDSVQNRIVEQRLVAQLRAMGYREEIQDTTVCRDLERGFSRCTRVRNVIVVVQGRVEGDGILLAAHYDSVDAAPGANDAGAAVATLLETARLLKLAGPPRNTIVFLFNEGEEFGLFGAHAFMREHPLAKTLKLALNVEARGSDGKSVMFETGENSGWLVEAYAESTPAPLSSSLFYEVYKILPNDTDLTVFKEHGLQGLNFAHGGQVAHYHTLLDNLDNLKLGTLQHHGDNVWGVLQAIKDKDLSAVRESNIVYTDILGLFIVKWEEPNSRLAAIALCGLLLLAMWNLRRRGQLHARSIRAGIYTFLATLILSGLAAGLLQKSAQFASAVEAPWRAELLPMQIALWALLAWLGLSVGRWFANNNQAISLQIGLTTCWVTLGLITSVWVVGISFLFILPGGLAVLLLLGAPYLQQLLGNKVVPVILILSSLAIAVLFMPIVYTLELMMGYGMSVAIGVVLSFVISSMLPLLAIDHQANATLSRVNYALLALFLVGFVWTASLSSYSDKFPQALNIVRVQDGNNDSWLFAESYGTPPAALLKQTLGENSMGRGTPWAAKLYPRLERPSENLAAVKYSLSGKEQTTSGRRVELAIDESSDDLRGISLYIPLAAGLNSITFDGQQQMFANEKSKLDDYYSFQCRGHSCGSMQLTLAFDKQKPAAVLLVKTLRGLPESDRDFTQNRDQLMTQIQFGDRTYVITEVSL